MDLIQKFGRAIVPLNLKSLIFMFNKEEKIMGGIINHVAKVISDLQTLNLLKKKDVTTTISIDEYTKKSILAVKILGSEEIVKLCLEKFKELASFTCKVDVKENNRENPAHSILIVSFSYCKLS